MTKFTLTKEQVQQLVDAGFTEEHIERYIKLQNEEPKGDTRYNKPKEDPKSSQEQIDKAILETEIYRKAKIAILQAQRKQIGYGLDKYPETLNPNSWSILETLDHIIEESIDKLHYEVMLRIKLEQLLLEKHDTEVEPGTNTHPREDILEEFRKQRPEMFEPKVTLFADNQPAFNISLTEPFGGLSDSELEMIKERQEIRKAKEKQLGKGTISDAIDALKYSITNKMGGHFNG
jgi:hypothetical protein